MSNALALRLVLSVPVTAVAALIVLIAYSGPSAESIRVAVLVALPTITITSVSTTLIAVFQARLAMARVAAIEVIVAIVVLGLVVAAVVADAGLNMVIAVTVVGALIMSASLAVLSTRLLHLRLRFDLDIWKRILKASFR